jgi:hypothetical protein
MVEIVAVGLDLGRGGKKIEHLAFVHLHDNHLQGAVRMVQDVRLLESEVGPIEGPDLGRVPDPIADMVERGDVEIAGGFGRFEEGWKADLRQKEECPLKQTSTQ